MMIWKKMKEIRKTFKMSGCHSSILVVEYLMIGDYISSLRYF